MHENLYCSGGVGLEKSDLFVLTGAGASYPIVPVTTVLTDQLMEWFLNEYCITSLDERVLPIRELTTGLAVKVSDSKGILNFEDFVDSLDILGSMLHSKETPLFYPAMNVLQELLVEKRILRRDGLPSEFLDVIYLKSVVHDVRTEILRRVFGAVKTHAQSQLTRAPINKLLRVLMAFYNLRVVSLNYDNLVDYSGIRFKTGFNRHQGADGYSEYDPQFERDHFAQSHLYLPLHGSIHFGKKPGAISPGRLHEPVWFDSIEQINRNEFGMNLHIADEIDSTMITGHRKWDNLVTVPYSSYYSMLRRFAFESPRWLIIGYGGQDPHVNVILRDALRYRWSSGQPPTLIICDKREKEQMKSLIKNIWGVPSLEDGASTNVAWHQVFLGHIHVGWMWNDGVEKFPIDSALERLANDLVT